MLARCGDCQLGESNYMGRQKEAEKQRRSQMGRIAPDRRGEGSGCRRWSKVSLRIAGFSRRISYRMPEEHCADTRGIHSDLLGPGSPHARGQIARSGHSSSGC